MTKLNHILFLLSLFVFASCSTSKPGGPKDEDPRDFRPGEGPTDIRRGSRKAETANKSELKKDSLPGEDSGDGQEVAQVENQENDGSAEDSEKSAESRLPPPKVGIWIDSVALDAFWALGYMQALEKAGVKIDRVVGTGFGCWIATSWALKGSGNQAEWQAFKWKNFETLGKGAQSLISRITGKNISEEKFRSQLQNWLVVEEFSSLKTPADCPLVENSSARNPALKSAASLGIYKSLWLQMQTPYWGEELMPDQDARYLSGLARFEVTAKDYDSFAGRGDDKVDFWIHLKTVPSRLWAQSQPWIFAAAAQQEWHQESWARSHEGRWIYQVPLFKSKVLRQGELIDFTRRRRLLLEGRQMASEWMSTPWFRNNFSDGFSPN